MRRNKKIRWPKIAIWFLLILILILIIVLPKPEPEPITTEQVIEDMAQSFNTDDYNQFQKHFSWQMVNVMEETLFHNVTKVFQEYSGKYLNNTLNQETTDGNFTYFIYDLTFENETAKMKLSFKPNETKVRGIWIHSNNLEQYL